MQYQSKKLIEQLNRSSKKLHKEESSKPKGVLTGKSNKKKWTISGIILGLIAGLPIGTFIEIGRLMIGKPWNDAVVGISIVIISVLVGAIAGYFYGAYLDGGT